MGCAFCASTIAGKVRDLRPSELLDQVLFTQLDSGLPVSNIVLMGIGEPLDNMDNVLRFLELVNSPHGMNIGMRHISLSTCGVARASAGRRSNTATGMRSVRSEAAATATAPGIKRAAASNKMAIFTSRSFWEAISQNLCRKNALRKIYARVSSRARRMPSSS